MEHCLRFALWTFYLVGFLHTKPVISAPLFNLDDMDLKSLTEVKCESNVTFTSPEYVEVRCYGKALEEFMNGLGKADMNCDDENNRSDDTLSVLEKISQKPRLGETTSQDNTTECRWGKKPFADFVEDLDSFAKKVNSKPRGFFQ